MMIAKTSPGRNRVQITNIWPQLDGGRTPVKRIAGDRMEIQADIFCDGHDKIAAEILHSGPGGEKWRAPLHFHDNDRWRGSILLNGIGRHRFTIEAWRDPHATWRADIAAKQTAGQDVTLEIQEGLKIAESAARNARGGARKQLSALLQDVLAEKNPQAQIEQLRDGEIGRLMALHAPRRNLSRYDGVFEIVVDRRQALASSWYELFPRSLGKNGAHGTFDDVIAHLPYVRDLGFDVLYFPPIHPIGYSNRKGRNNALNAGPDDVGSVYAIGSSDGGHDAIHPQLGAIEDFRRLVQAARDEGLEIALDFAIQCSPDHPWIAQHPEWFDWRPDGSLKHAENPPKKYEDIVNVDFYGDNSLALWRALRDVVLFWIANGVRIFRVDNPHTKPLPFWRWLIGEINGHDPDVIFLAEAFTRPRMMEQLAKIGFQQSYSYFTWRNTKAELTAYLTELSGAMGEYYRPNFFANTPDINPFYLQTSGRPGFIVRATLAATLSSNWGIYSGFEFCESAAPPDREEYQDSEKYQLRPRDFDAPGNVKDHIRALNQARRGHAALQDFRNIVFLNAWNENIIAYAKLSPARDHAILALVNLDPHHPQSCQYEIPLWEFGLPDDGRLAAVDLLTGARFELHGKIHDITLSPEQNPVILWQLSRAVGELP